MCNSRGRHDSSSGYLTSFTLCALQMPHHPKLRSWSCNQAFTAPIALPGLISAGLGHRFRAEQNHCTQWDLGVPGTLELGLGRQGGLARTMPGQDLQLGGGRVANIFPVCSVGISLSAMVGLVDAREGVCSPGCHQVVLAGGLGEGSSVMVHLWPCL